MFKSHKWIDGIDGTTPVRRAAVRSLKDRLRGVEAYLAAAARQRDEEGELIHQLRVATRRSSAALKLFAPLIRRRDSKWMRKTLRGIRNTAGQARDLDVLLQNHPDVEALRERIQRCRDEAQAALHELEQQLQRGGRLYRRIKRLCRGVRRNRSAVGRRRFADWAPSQLRKTAQRFFAAVPDDLRDVAALHRLRVRGKELRYAIELLAPAFPERLRQETYPLVEAVQERLGRIHDCTVAAQCCEDWALSATDPLQAEQLRNLAGEQRHRLEELLTEFGQWWSSEGGPSLQREFETLATEVQHAAS